MLCDSSFPTPSEGVLLYMDPGLGKDVMCSMSYLLDSKPGQPHRFRPERSPAGQGCRLDMTYPVPDHVSSQ
jgi:hypothetical protein